VLCCPSLAVIPWEATIVGESPYHEGRFAGVKGKLKRLSKDRHADKILKELHQIH